MDGSRMLNNTEDSRMNMLDKPAPATRDRRPWEPPALKTVGTIGEVLQQGGGKLSIVAGDPGEGRKQSGGE
jgi:hypothetical protein